MGVTAGCDFFVVPTLTFRLLNGFVVLSHDPRRILHVGVTGHPTAEWTARQIVEAIPGDESQPRLPTEGSPALCLAPIRRARAAGARAPSRASRDHAAVVSRRP
jgi:hypothetical protein